MLYVFFFSLGEDYHIIDVNVAAFSYLFSKNVVYCPLKYTRGVFQSERQSTEFVFSVVDRKSGFPLSFSLSLIW